jgi:DNA-binding response OmpR family regulator
MGIILIIEDNFEIRENISEILQLAKYQVIVAENGKQGAELALKHLPDVILCDIMMDLLDGYGVLYMLKKHIETSTIPFIFITAKTQMQDLRKGMEMGADDYLIKPFNNIELLSAIETRLKKRDVQKEYYSKSMQNLNQLVLNKEGLEEFKEIIEQRKYRIFKRRQVVHYEGDKVTGIYLIIDGKVKVSKIAEDGRELIVGIFSTDEFIGANVILSQKVYPDTAVALEDCTLCFFSIQQLEKLIQLYPNLAGKFIKILSNEICEKEEQLLQLAYHSVRKRIAEVLLRYSRQNCPNGEYITLGRTELASLSGTASETVSRTLTEFENEGMITKVRNGLSLVDIPKLSRLKN